MSQQIAVRLTEDVVAFIDQLVASGAAPSRASVVVRALERERRRQLALRDVAILSQVHDDPDDLEGLARFAGRQALDLD
jgi:Arc/MetJ-type ribon-helix-helix transcriptional regulator